MNNQVFDIECYPNIFTLTAIDSVTEQRFVFEISWRINQIDELMHYLNLLRLNGCSMVGFNNCGYDYPVLHFIIRNRSHITPAMIYQRSSQIINTPWDQRFINVVWENDQYVEQIDLYKIHHFDNPARATSLKVLEFNMRMDSVEDLPFPPGTILTSSEMDTLLIYNDHDVVATLKFLKESKSHIDFRTNLSEKLGKNVMNFNDTKIGKDYFITELEKRSPGSCYQMIGNRREKRQTPRDMIHLKDVLLPYIQFEHPEFKRVHEWFRSNSIRSTKGEFNVSAVVRDFEFKFGTGGLHGCIDPCVIVSDDENVIEDADVISYYPSLAITNRIYPAHLGENFCDIYQELFEQRKQYPKSAPENKMLKLALNGTYGDSNSKYSPLYDPQYTMTITINGQLLLCMLVEQMMKVPDLLIISVNTDGVCCKYQKRYEEMYRKICAGWSKHTGLTLEFEKYKMMAVADVNNYIGVPCSNV